MSSYFAIQWHITDNCDLRCKHCYIYARKMVKPEETPWDNLVSTLDGLAPIHNKLRRPGSFKATVNAIPIIREAGIKCVVMSTVSAKNMNDIPQLVDVVVGNQVDVYAFARYFLDTCWLKFIALHYSGGFQQKYKKQKRHNVLNHNYIEFPSHKFFAV